MTQAEEIKRTARRIARRFRIAENTYKTVQIGTNQFDLMREGLRDLSNLQKIFLYQEATLLSLAAPRSFFLRIARFLPLGSQSRSVQELTILTTEQRLKIFTRAQTLTFT